MDKGAIICQVLAIPASRALFGVKRQLFIDLRSISGQSASGPTAAVSDWLNSCLLLGCYIAAENDNKLKLADARLVIDESYKYAGRLISLTL
jgi:hypothetical protein